MAKTPISTRLANVLKKGYILTYYSESILDDQLHPGCWEISTQQGITIALAETLDQCVSIAIKNIRKSKTENNER